jgi:alanyl-tRNA synthetase
VKRTARLVYEDPRALAFEALVQERDGSPDKENVVELDRTAFYAEGGGQPADHGALEWQDASARVVDVQVDDQGRVLHRLEGPLPSPGVQVRGRVDRARRLELTALHTAQHTLSRALDLEASAPTVSARLGSVATIDVARVDIPETELARAESLANSLVDDDVEVRVWYPSETELAALPLRKSISKAFERVRVVAVGEFDVTPCGGTHCERSSAMGLIAIRGVERYKGMTRVSFTAGARGRRELIAAHRRLGALTKLAGGDLEASFDRARAELAQAREERGDLQSRLATLLAAELLPRLSSPVATFVDDDLDAVVLRDVVARVAKATPDRTIVGVGADRNGRPIVVRSGSQNAADVVRLITARLGGRGGGRPEFAEGRLAPGADITELGRLLAL